MAAGTLVARDQNDRDRRSFFESSRPHVFVAGGTSFLGRNLIQALIRAGYGVRSLALTMQQRQILRSLGCSSVSAGEPYSLEAVKMAAKGCIYAVHCACAFVHFDTSKDNLIQQANNLVTINIVKACQALDIAKLIVQSSEAVLYCGEPMINFDETHPYPANPVGSCASSLKDVEQIVLAANSSSLKTTVIRPRLLWGLGESSFLPAILATVNAGKLRLVNGGAFLTSTCHVQNACEGILCALRSSKGGDVYFLTDGPPVLLVDFISDLLRASGVRNVDEVVKKKIPLWLAKHVALVAEHVAASFGQRPSLTQSGVGLIGQEVTLMDTQARRILGYRSLQTMEDGFTEMLHRTLVRQAAAAREEHEEGNTTGM